MTLMRYRGIVGALLALSVPFMVQAQGTAVRAFPVSLPELLHLYFIPAIFCVSAVAFIWAMFDYYIFGWYDEEMKEKSKALMVWAIGVFLVMAIAWVLIAFLTGSFEVVPAHA